MDNVVVAFEFPPFAPGTGCAAERYGFDACNSVASATHQARACLVMPLTDPFYRKLGAFLEPTDAERAFLERVLERRRDVAAGDNLIGEGDPAVSSFIVLDGWLARHKALADGRRQILSFVLPGDVIGIESHLIAEATASVTALTRCTLAEFRPAAIVKLLSEHARLAAALMWATAREEAFLGERMLSLGRRPAIDRVGHLFVELYHRLRLVGLAEGESYTAPLNLDQISDALGLSVVHVSRTTGQLRAARLLDRRGHRIILLDRPRLEKKVEFPGLYLGRALDEGERFLRPPFGPEDIANSI